MQNQSKLSPRGTNFSSLSHRNKESGKIMSSHKGSSRYTNSALIFDAVAAKTTTATITLLLLIENFQLANAKGLVGKLPGNPASCNEEPCNSDPQQVLYALKWASLFFGCALMCPLFGYGLYKIWLKLKSLCGVGGGSGSGSGRGKKGKARHGDTLEANSRSSSSSAASHMSTGALNASPRKFNPQLGGQSGKKLSSSIGPSGHERRQTNSSSSGQSNQTTGGSGGGGGGGGAGGELHPANGNLISSSNNWRQTSGGANGMLAYRQSVQLGMSSSSSVGQPKRSPLSQSFVSRDSENQNHGRQLEATGQQQQLFDEVNELARNKQLAELLANSNEVLQRQQQQNADRRQHQLAGQQQQQFYPHAHQHRYSMFVGGTGGPGSSSLVSGASRRSGQQSPMGDEQSNSPGLNSRTSTSTRTSKLRSAGHNGSGNSSGKRKVHPAPDEPKVVGSFMAVNNGQQQSNVPSSEAQNFNVDESCDIESNSHQRQQNSHHHHNQTNPTTPTTTTTTMDKAADRLGHHYYNQQNGQQDNYYTQHPAAGELLALPMAAGGQHRHSIDGSLLNQLAFSQMSAGHQQQQQRLGQPEVAAPPIQLSSFASNASTANANADDGPFGGFSGQGHLQAPAQSMSRSGSERHHRRASTANGSSSSSRRQHISNANRLAHSSQQQQRHRRPPPPSDVMMAAERPDGGGHGSGGGGGGQLLMLGQHLHQRDRRPSLNALT